MANFWHIGHLVTAYFLYFYLHYFKLLMTLLLVFWSVVKLLTGILFKIHVKSEQQQKTTLHMHMFC